MNSQMVGDALALSLVAASLAWLIVTVVKGGDDG